MQMQQLRYFLAVLEAGSFTRAAEQLGRTQQAVSKALRLLEVELGVRLLDRDLGRPKPTVFGIELTQFARQVMQDEAAFQGRLKAVRYAARGSVRLGASPTLASTLAIAAVQMLRDRHEGIAVQVIDGLQPTFLRALERGELDAAVYIETVHSAAIGKSIATETLAQAEYRVIAGTQHPLVCVRQPIGAADLALSHWVLGANSGEVESAWREVFESAGLALPEPQYVTTSIEFVRGLLTRGHYVTVLPTGLIARELRSGELSVVAAPDFAWRRPVTLAYRMDSKSSPSLRAMIQALHESGEGFATELESRPGNNNFKLFS